MPEIDHSALRATNGVMYTESLFMETLSTKMKKSGHKPPFTLKEKSTEDLVSIYEVYMDSVDETEAALVLFGSLPHWKKMTSLKWFMNGRPEVGFPGLIQWRKDMWDRDRSSAKKTLISLTRQNNVTAAKALYQMATEDLKALSSAQPKSKEKPELSNVIDDGFDFLDKQAK